MLPPETDNYCGAGCCCERRTFQATSYEPTLFLDWTWRRANISSTQESIQPQSARRVRIHIPDPPVPPRKRCAGPTRRAAYVLVEPSGRHAHNSAGVELTPPKYEDLRRLRDGATQGVLQRQAVEAQEEPSNQSMLYTCCMETVCIGCALKHGMIENCPFCRTPLTLDDEAQIARIQKRVKANDPVAIHHLGICYRNGDCGLEKDMSRAVELFERAAVLGLKKAHFDLGYIFDEDTDDKGIAKDMSRASELYEIAAKQGHVLARFSLGIIDLKSGKYGLALKHWIISAKLGCPASLGAIKDLFREGLASKSDYAEAMRGYHDAVKEMSSPERDEAKAFAEAGGHG